MSFFNQCPPFSMVTIGLDVVTSALLYLCVEVHKSLTMALRQTREREIREAVCDYLGHHDNEVVKITFKYFSNDTV